jgi:hypothetical protein
MSRCPVPNCANEAPGRGGVFCVGHYFQIPRAYTALIFSTKFACQRADDDETRKHLQEQLAGYIASAIRQLPDQGNKHVA